MTCEAVRVFHEPCDALRPGLALLRLRRTEPLLERPFKVPHALLAVVFTAASIGLAGDAHEW